MLNVEIERSLNIFVGTGFQIPEYAASALNITQQAPGLAPVSAPGASPNVSAILGSQAPGQDSTAPPIATQCFMLSNMFDPTA